MIVAPIAIRRAENGRARHKGVGACGGSCRNVFDLDAAIDFESNRLATLGKVHVNAGPDSLDLLERGGNEGLASKAWVHAHEENHVDLVHDPVEVVERCARIKDQPALAALVVDELQAAVDVLRGLGVKGDVTGARLGKVGDQGVHG